MALGYHDTILRKRMIIHHLSDLPLHERVRDTTTLMQKMTVQSN